MFVSNNQFLILQFQTIKKTSFEILQTKQLRRKS